MSNGSTKVEDEPKGEYQLAPAGGDFLRLRTALADEMAADLAARRNRRRVASTVHRSLGEVCRFGTLRDGELMMVESLPQRHPCGQVYVRPAGALTC